MGEQWFQEAFDRLHEDRALFALADMVMRDHCSAFGGLPKDIETLLKLRCALEAPASKLMANLMAMPQDDRRAVAHRLRPTSSTPIQKVT